MTMTLLIKGKREGTEIVDVSPHSAGWRFVGFAAYRLEPRQRLPIEGSADDECCVVVLSGIVTVKSHGETWREIGERNSVFEERSPFAVYLPRSDSITVEAHSRAEIGIARAPGDRLLQARLIEPSTMKRFPRGQGLNQRFVCDILPQSAPATHLLV